MFKADRIFHQRNPRSGEVEWYFQAREGLIGPYKSRDIAEKMLKAFIERCIAAGDDGGRSQKKTGLTLEKVEDFAVFEFDPSKRKKGKDQ